MAEDNALELVKLRNEFYRDNYRRLVLVLMVAIIVLLASVGTLLYMYTHPPKPQYFATDPEGRIIRLTPLSEPNLSSAALLQWANIAAVASFTYDFANYRKQLQDASQYFTTSGWAAFVDAIKASNNLTAVTQKKLVSYAVATGAPVILEEGEIQGVYSWKVQMPMLITYESASEVSQQNVVVTMMIQRVSTVDYEKGIGISQLIVTDNGSVS